MYFVLNVFIDVDFLLFFFACRTKKKVQMDYVAMA